MPLASKSVVKRFCLLLLCFLLIGLAAKLTFAQQGDFEGIYRCEGVGANGETYAGLVEIARIDDTYRVTWMIPPHRVYVGIAILQGDVLAVSFAGGTLGVVLYTMQKDGRVLGSWSTAQAEGHVFTETLTKTDHPPGPAPQSEPMPPQQQPPGVRGIVTL